MYHQAGYTYIVKATGKDRNQWTTSTNKDNIHCEHQSPTELGHQLLQELMQSLSCYHALCNIPSKLTCMFANEIRDLVGILNFTRNCLGNFISEFSDLTELEQWNFQRQEGIYNVEICYRYITFSIINAIIAKPHFQAYYNFTINSLYPFKMHNCYCWQPLLQ